MTTTNTPNEALRLVDEHREEIQVLITDVVLPEMNGRDLSDLMRALYPNLKTLFMSGYTANVISHRGILEDGVNFIQKPFSMKELATKIMSALNQK